MVVLPSRRNAALCSRCCTRSTPIHRVKNTPSANMTAAAAAIRLPFFESRTFRGNEPVSSPGRAAVSIEKRFGSIPRQVYVHDFAHAHGRTLSLWLWGGAVLRVVCGLSGHRGQGIVLNVRVAVTQPEPLLASPILPFQRCDDLVR